MVLSLRSTEAWVLRGKLEKGREIESQRTGRQVTKEQVRSQEGFGNGMFRSSELSDSWD